MIAYVWVALGSAVGGVARYAVSGAVATRIGEIFPWGTLVVNVSGCLVIGICAAIVAPSGALPGDATMRELMIIGLCGGYTTFSSFSLQTLNLARDGEWVRAAGNIAASTGVCLIAVWAGIVAGTTWFGG